MLGHSPGADDFDGGPGRDTLRLFRARSGAAVDLGRGTVVISGVTDRVRRAESVFGTAHVDVLLGSAGGEYLTGWDSDDRVKGLGGNDTLTGDGVSWCCTTGRDYLSGGPGNDTIAGDGTEDQGGNDTIRGGDGRDTLVGDGIWSVAKRGPGKDRIYSGDGDDRIFADHAYEPHSDARMGPGTPTRSTAARTTTRSTARVVPTTSSGAPATTAPTVATERTSAGVSRCARAASPKPRSSQDAVRPQ